MSDTTVTAAAPAQAPAPAGAPANPSAPAPAPAAKAAPATAAPTPAAPVTAPAFDAEAIGKLIEAKLAEAIGKLAPPKVDQPDPLKDAPAWARDIDRKLAGLEASQAAQAEANRRGALERTVLAGVPEPNAAKARTMLAGLLAERGISKLPDDASALAGDLSRALQAIAPDIYRVPGSPHAALPRAAQGGGIDWARVNSIAELPTEEIRNIPEEHLDRIIHGAGGDPSGRPSTMPRTIRLVPGGRT